MIRISCLQRGKEQSASLKYTVHASTINQKVNHNLRAMKLNQTARAELNGKTM